MAQASQQRGALLLDALIALAVCAVGVLGEVAVFAQAIRNVENAHCRSVAAELAQALVGRMWAEDPAALATHYDAQAGAGYAGFVRELRRLPGADRPGNAPEIGVAAGAGPASRRVTIAVHWQLPGEPAAHRYGLVTVIGRN
jgi:type IV pilus assembly protein PilV